MDVAGLMTTVPWLMNMLRKVPGATGVFERFAQWCYDQLEEKREALKVANKGQQPRDVISWLIKSEDEASGMAGSTSAAIQEDARVLIIAGSDTAASAITNTLYFLAKYPAVCEKLQQLLKVIFPAGDTDWNYAKVKAIPYLDYIINETLRLRPAAPIGFLRETPPQGLQVDDVFIPGGTIVSVPTWAIHRDSRNWERPDDFVPERWEKMSTNTAPYIAFQRGPFSCAGKNLAIMELRMVISRIVLRYRIAFAPGEDGEAFQSGAKEKLTLWLPPLRMVFTRR
ncbi:hypothetical protein JDV02_008036 [Purpureocillium takamizusanense]|uniref:Cytochrome P450 n=1 Tax=Purpureocillium takamizusanense TaxID=2060973 RepID=A0A9Q8VEB4_9HYPO|nr:uncharacterized protein JDV02_008036 [Purpureocillium takamizusanense]UNI22116.1 hypothetical protein JDV02_008036 [Purpureocillium takamizusanense]